MAKPTAVSAPGEDPKDKKKLAKLPSLRPPLPTDSKGRIDKDAVLDKVRRQVSSSQHRVERELVESTTGLRKELRILSGQAFYARIGVVCDIADNRNAPFKTRLDAIQLLARYGLNERTEVLLPKDEIVRAIARVTAPFLDEDQFSAWLDLVVEALEESA